MYAGAAFGQANAPKQPAFEVASVKPSPPTGFAGPGGRAAPNDPVSLSIPRATLKLLIAQSYDVPESQVSGGPAWTGADIFDIAARAANPATHGEMMQMLATLLADRFQLEFHRETKATLVYALVVAKGGPKLGPQFHPARAEDPRPVPAPGKLAMRFGMRNLASIATVYLKIPFPSGGEAPLSEPDPLPVIDQTGLSGDYDVVLDLQHSRDWFVVLEQQLGLKLEPRKLPMDMFIIDRAVKPSAN